MADLFQNMNRVFFFSFHLAGILIEHFLEGIAPLISLRNGSIKTLVPKLPFMSLVFPKFYLLHIPHKQRVFPKYEHFFYDESICKDL